MRPISFEEKKKIGLDILIEIDAFCKRNDIKYFLAYGTLLGAVRHKGFIPWDDDVDLIMFDKDYLRFINSFNDSENKDLFCASYENGDFSLPFAKVFNLKTKIYAKNRKDTMNLSIGVDIFPYSVLSDDKKKCIRISNKCFFLLKMNRYKLYNSFSEVCTSNFSFSKFLFFWFVKLHFKKCIFKKTIKLKKKFVTQNEGFCKYLFDSKKTKLFRKEWFNESVEVVFEGHAFPAPIEYDLYLKEYYGDYMELPPEEQRVPHVTENAFWID